MTTLNTEYQLYRVKIRIEPGGDVIDKPKTLLINVGLIPEAGDVGLNEAKIVAIGMAESYWLGDNYELRVESIALVGDLGVLV